MIALVISMGLYGCLPGKPTRAFSTYDKPSAPDYSDLYYWAAHPEKFDSADVVPGDSMINGQSKASADVFFIHPTTYTGAPGENQWNAPVDDDKLNRHTDRATIRNQATIFNQCFRVFAPRYRQAHYESYFTRRKKDGQLALDLAYEDVRNAFLYYMENENNGRPLVIAGHSQGSTHAILLLQEFFDGKNLTDQLIAAYIPGMLVRDTFFNNLTTCFDSSDVHCICSWRTFKEGHFPKNRKRYTADDVIIVNPLSWTTNVVAIDKDENPGSVMLNFYDGLVYNSAGAQIAGGFLWTEKPEFRGSFWLMTKNYHQGDFNLYYQSVRENACHRLNEYLDMTEMPHAPGESSILRP